MTTPWIVLGGGGHARVVVDALRTLGMPILGFTDPAGEGRTVEGVDCLGDDRVLDRYPPDVVVLANGLGSVTATTHRAALFDRVRARSYRVPSFAHPGALVADSAVLAEGAQVMAGAVIQPGCRIGENAIVNTRAAVDHDCTIEPHVHVAPGATISGGVSVGRGSHVGTGASVIQGVRIGAGSVVGAGAVVVRDVPDGVTVMGVPAKPRNR